MGGRQILGRLKRLAGKSPAYIVRRLTQEARMEAERFVAPVFAMSISGHRLAGWAGLASVDELWRELASRPFPARTGPIDRAAYDAEFPGSSDVIFAAAERALNYEVDLLGTGPIHLGQKIDWLQDFKTGDRWPVQFCRAIDYLNKGRPSDVKVPWEISRLQWLLPVGQAFLLSGGDERYAQGVRDVLESWIASNPYAYSVNWSCTMEPALRLQAWTWLFHVFAGSKSWADTKFRDKFLTSLYLHGAFTEIHIERSSVNGNHLTADAAGLVFAGLFFGGIGAADRWATAGWRTLREEIVKQVHPDGVDFEASVPYHRLVTELFVGPARYRKALGIAMDDTYAQRLAAMARFTAAYMRPDGSSPHWGDADDGRGLPLGTQALDDHRYLPGLISDALTKPVISSPVGPSGDELYWHGVNTTCVSTSDPVASVAFTDGGVYILADENNHVFIDCGPVGLAGLGGHGHNDALSLEAWLSGVPLIMDPGSYVYTADFDARNRFRSTASHNTVQVDGAEINRLHAPDNLWNLHEDAKAHLVTFESDGVAARFTGEHQGYKRLPDPVLIRRTVALEHGSGKLTIIDDVEASATHSLSVPLHLAPGVAIQETLEGFVLTTHGKQFDLAWSGEGWSATTQDTQVSPSYGVLLPSSKIVWTAQLGSTRLSVCIKPRA